MNRMQFHPTLRSQPDDYLESRSSWYRFVYPDPINWYGDCELYCREIDYQSVLDNVPCLTGIRGTERRCVLVGEELDAWRVQVARWLSCFDEQGNQIKKWVPLKVKAEEQKVEVPRKRAPWFGKGLAQWMNRGKPE